MSNAFDDLLGNIFGDARFNQKIEIQARKKEFEDNLDDMWANYGRGRISQLPEYPSITFDCANCGRKVVTDGIRDKRTRFCCAECEKKYWKHRPWDETGKRRDSGSARMQFHSVEEYASWERRANE